MSAKIVHLEGETWITLETVAECYDVSTAWVVSIYDTGLLGRGHRAGGRVMVATRSLDRVARIRRLQRYYGLDFDVIVGLLGTTDPYD